MNNLADLIQRITIWAIPVLFAITVHEVAHGWLASKLGDKTAAFMGRITLNPFKHVDLIGTIIVPLLFFMVGGFIFGWAKPVPVVWQNLKHPRRDSALVAAAGPVSNLLMALIWAMIARLAVFVSSFGFSPIKVFFYMGMAGVSINIMLMVLNFIPIPPLDGSRVLSSVLPRKWALQYERIEPFGLMILVLLIFSGVLRGLIGPIYEFLQALILNSFMFLS